MEEKEYLPRPAEVLPRPEKEKKGWLSLKEVAGETGISRPRLRFLCREGIIPAKKAKREPGGKGNPKHWVVEDLEAVWNYLRKRPSFEKFGALGGRGKKARLPGASGRKLLMQALKG